MNHRNKIKAIPDLIERYKYCTDNAIKIIKKSNSRMFIFDNGENYQFNYLYDGIETDIIEYEKKPS